MSLDQHEELRGQVEEQFRWCNRGSRSFSLVHHGSLALAATLSAAAAGATKFSWVQESQRSDWTAGLAGLAALMATLAAAGGFERKWRTNRVNRGRCRRLLIQLSAPDANLPAIRAELLRIIEDQDQGIVGQQVAMQPATSKSQEFPIPGQHGAGG